MKPFLDPQVRALIAVGFMGWPDLVFLLGWGATIAYGLRLWFVDQLTVLAVVLLATLQAFVVSAWLIMIGYRACYHVIMARSDINTMPESAAKLAISYQLRQ